MNEIKNKWSGEEEMNEQKGTRTQKSSTGIKHLSSPLVLCARAKPSSIRKKSIHAVREILHIRYRWHDPALHLHDQQ